MKKSILLIYLLLAFSIQSNYLIGQNQIPNHDFETWTGGEPENWDSSNENILGVDFVTVTREQTNPYSGTSSAKITTVTQNIIFVGPVTMPGILTLGDVVIDVLNATGTVTGGVPVSGLPKFLYGYYKYQPQGGDSCYIGIGLSKWNGTSRDTLAYSYLPIGTPTTNWTQFTLPIQYTVWQEPDSMNIMLLSSNLLFGNPVGGSTLWVDSLWLEYSGVAVQDIGLNKELFVSAINDGNTLIVNTRGKITDEIEIYSIAGNKVSSLKGISSDKFEVNIAYLQRGTYIIRAVFPDRKTHAVKFTKL